MWCYPYGLSTLDTAYQTALPSRLHVSFPLLSDEGPELANALALPTMRFDSMALIKCLMLIIEKDVIKKVFYPMFPSHENSGQIVARLTARRG